MNDTLLTNALLAAALGQSMIALLNFKLPDLMRWRPDLAKLPLLLREVFHVHAWFISITLLLFAALTFRFAAELPDSELGRWLCASIAAFWGARTVVQIAYYSASHWRNDRIRLVLHLVLLFVYGSFTLAYGMAARG